MDKSNQGEQRIRSLQRVSFAYACKSTVPADTMPAPACNPENVVVQIVHVVGFIHGTESILAGTRLCVRGFKTARYRPAMDASLHIMRHWYQLAAARHNPGFFSGLRTRSPRPLGLIMQWRPVSTGCIGGQPKTAAPRGRIRRGVRWPRGRASGASVDAAAAAAATDAAGHRLRCGLCGPLRRRKLQQRQIRCVGPECERRPLARVDVNTMNIVPAHQLPAFSPQPPPPPPPPPARRLRCSRRLPESAVASYSGGLSRNEGFSPAIENMGP